MLTTAIPTGVAAFLATNLDDLVILTLLFAQVNNTFRYRHIIAGQYLGFTVLVTISLLGFFGSLILPNVWMDICGFIPIAIGLNRLVNLHEDDSDEHSVASSVSFTNRSFLSPQIYSVAFITIAIGGDNIGIYTPLFANSKFTSLLIILSVFFVLVRILCYVARLLSHQKAIICIIERYGKSLVPFLLIGLGVYIVLDNSTLALLSVAVVFLGWMSYDRLRHRIPPTEA